MSENDDELAAENAKLKQALEGLNKLFKEKFEAVTLNEEAEAVIARLKAEVARLEQGLEELRAALEAEQQRASLLAHTATEASEAKQAAQLECSQTHSRLLEAENQRADLERALREAEDELARLRSERGEMEAMAAALRSAVAAQELAEDQLARARAAVAALEERLARAQGDDYQLENLYDPPDCPCEVDYWPTVTLWQVLCLHALLSHYRSPHPLPSHLHLSHPEALLLSD